MKRIVYWIISLILPTVAVILVVEVLGAFFHTGKGMNEFNAQLGWSPKPDFSYNSVQTDSAGDSYDVSVSTNKERFVAWGNPKTDKTKVLFIGDSFTVGPYISDDEAYFSQVKKRIDVEVFAAGAEGYGTLQQLMLLQKYAGEINPDIFVLQFCTNDFVNNSLDLEGKSIVRNQQSLRPYFVEDEVVYRHPKYHWYPFLYQHSKIFRLLDTGLLQIQADYYGGYMPPPHVYTDGFVLLQTDNGLVELSDKNKDAERVTGTLLSMMVDAVPDETLMFTFNCSTKNQSATERWERVASEAGFVSLPGVSAAVESAASNGGGVYAYDGSHWSPPGHEIAGKVLAQRLKEIIGEPGNQDPD